MKKILFVEDEPALQTTLGNALQKEGFSVTAALDGQEGLRLAAKEHPDLVLLDLILPKRSGFEVLQALKENEDTHQIPVIVLTNLENVQDIDRALALGATTYLVKANYEIDDVISKIRQTFEDHMEK